MQEKVLVTGANGYIGRHVVDELLKKDRHVIACDFFNSKINSNAEFVNYDVLNNTGNRNLYDFFDRPNHIIHLAWQDGFNHNAKSHTENLMKHFDFIKNVIDGGCTSLSVMGTAHEIGYHEGKIDENTPCNPLSYYGIAKNTLRQLVFVYTRDMDVSIKWLRAYYITGDDNNNHSVFTKILQAAAEGKKEFPFVEGTNKFDFIDVNELAFQIASAGVQTKVNGIINVCSGKPLSLKDRVEEFIKNKGLDIKLNYGVFPTRKYDSPIVYGDTTLINKIIGADCG